MKLFRALSILILLVLTLNVFSQDSTGLSNKLYNLPDKLFNGIQSKLARTENSLERQTARYLRKLERREKKLRDKLRKTDSVKAKELFGNTEEQYAQLQQTLQGKADKFSSYSNTYSPNIDSVTTALKFLQQPNTGQLAEGTQRKLQTALYNYQELQGKFHQAEQIKKALRERQQYLKQQLQNTPLAKEFRKFQKDVYYYRAQVDEYKKSLSDPSKLQARLLQLANKIPAFKDFFGKHSELASLFRMPENFGSPASLQGLQTRANVQGIIQQRIEAGGPGAQQMLQQNIAGAQSQLHQLKEKINQLGNGGGDIDMPGFKPNNQRTKSFLKRLEFGTNIQTQKAQYYFPATSDIGLSVGYKLNDKSIIGVGASYKLGLGSGWNNIRFTHQGIGLRSFLEWKLKGSFYVSGGYEQNYKAAFNSIIQLRDESAWQQSALIGLSKKYRVSKKFKGNMQLLYDFLHARQVPRTQPLQFRIGYTLK
jgi:hypothetical protein